MTVSVTADLHPRLRRLTFTAEEFGGFATEGPDECFGWLLPTGGQPHLRWYTVRAHRPARAEIDVDVVLHGHEGPASRFAAHARSGDLAGFRSSGAAYTPPEGARTQLLLADETSLPALASIVESMPPGTTGVRAVVEVPDRSWPDLLRDTVAGAVEVDWRARGDNPPGSCLQDVVAGDPAPLDYAWVCAEAGGVRTVRRHLIDAWGLDRRRVTFSGYWRQG
jgi:NADPH-dependent ferric siderophore reductase